MIAKLPRGAWCWAWVLAFMAGLINVVGLLSFEHQPVTHLTGTATSLASAVGHADFRLALHFLWVIAAFMFGAIVSGLVIQDSTLRLGRRYGVVLVLESLFLVAAVYGFDRGLSVGTYCAGVACGLQNAMVTTYSGTVIRTSHLTGMFTDLGIFIGHALRKIPVEKREQRRLFLCLVVISAFMTGGGVGAWLFSRWQYRVLYVPAAIAFAMAGGYISYMYGLPTRRGRWSSSS